jgi:predicted nucleic acid-binding Zn ribbon protein
MERDPRRSVRRQPKRIGDLLPAVTAELGLDRELRVARQMTAWERLVAELVPAAAGSTRMLAVQPPALLVSAADTAVAQELRLRQQELLAAFAGSPDGEHLLELRVSVRPDRRPPGER